MSLAAAQRHCIIRRMFIVALLLYPAFGLALPEYANRGVPHATGDPSDVSHPYRIRWRLFQSMRLPCRRGAKCVT